MITLLERQYFNEAKLQLEKFENRCSIIVGLIINNKNYQSYKII